MSQWETRPVPRMKCIVIAQAGKMYPHAHVVTPTAEPQELTPAEYDRAALIAAAPDLRDSLGWIVEFCNEHPEWFGEGSPDDGAEYEWLHNARALIARTDPKEITS